MITVFGAPPTRGLRVLWMLEELGLEYELRRVDFRNRHADEEFMRASPAGAAPGLVDGEVRMMESMAIVEYLGARYGPTPLVLSVNHHDFPAYLQFLHYGEGSLSAPLNVVIASRFFAPEEEKQNWGAKMAVQMVLGRCSAVAAKLERTPTSPASCSPPPISPVPTPSGCCGGSARPTDWTRRSWITWRVWRLDQRFSAPCGMRRRSSEPRSDPCPVIERERRRLVRSAQCRGQGAGAPAPSPRAFTARTCFSRPFALGWTR